MKISNEAKVGLLVTAALAALLWGLNYLKGKDVFTTRNKYFVVYPNVDGLVKSNPVLMNGFRVGIIDGIDFLPDKSGRLVVSILVGRNVFIARNSKAVIFNSDLIGAKALRLDLGNDPNPLQEGDTLAGELEAGVAQQLGKEVGPIKDKTERLIVSIDSVVNMMYSLFDTNTKGNLRSGIQHLDHAMASVDEMTASNGELRIALSNVASITGNLKNNNRQIEHILKNLDQVSDSLSAAHFASTIQNADAVLVQSGEILKKVNEGQGTLGMLVNDRQFYAHLDSTAHDLDVLLKDLKSNPKRYVRFSVFGGGK